MKTWKCGTSNWEPLDEQQNYKIEDGNLYLLDDETKTFKLHDQPDFYKKLDFTETPDEWRTFKTEAEIEEFLKLDPTPHQVLVEAAEVKEIDANKVWADYLCETKVEVKKKMRSRKKKETVCGYVILYYNSGALASAGLHHDVPTPDGYKIIRMPVDNSSDVRVEVLKIG